MTVLTSRVAEPGVAVERLDRGDFDIQKQKAAEAVLDRQQMRSRAARSAPGVHRSDSAGAGRRVRPRRHCDQQPASHDRR